MIEIVPLAVLDQFQEHIERYNLCRKLDSVLLAVSGGIDSIVMFYLFQEAGFNFGVAHCNFQLRGSESEADQQFVATVCKEFDVPLFIRRFDTESYAWEKTLSIQMAARELRYNWFHELLDSKLYTQVATAHHFDDTMETILLNLTRGSGIDGLSGIPVKNGKIIRPMLFASRKQVEQYAIKKGLVWREDESNQSDAYQRNFIRHQIVPKLRELNPSLDVTWKEGLEKIKNEISIVQSVFNSWKSKFVKEKTNRIVIDKNGLELYKNNPIFLWRYLRGMGFNFDQATDILKAAQGQSGKRFFSSSHLLVVDRETIIVIDRQDHWTDVMIDETGGSSYLGPWCMTVEEDLEEVNHSNEMVAVLDAAQLRFPLMWRKWKPGDFFYPLGMGHKKKLSDYLIDEKLSIADKEKVTVIESEGKIAWVAGYRIDDRFKLTDLSAPRIKFKLTLY